MRTLENHGVFILLFFFFTSLCTTVMYLFIKKTHKKGIFLYKTKWAGAQAPLALCVHMPERKSGKSLADHYFFQKQLQHHPVKCLASVCLLMWEGMAMIIFQHRKPDRDASTTPAITSHCKVRLCLNKAPETFFVLITKWNKKAVKSFM